MTLGTSTHSGSMVASKLSTPKTDIHNLNITMLRYRELTADGAVIRTLDFTRSQLRGNKYNITEEKDVDVGKSDSLYNGYVQRCHTMYVFNTVSVGFHAGDT